MLFQSLRVAFQLRENMNPGQVVQVDIILLYLTHAPPLLTSGGEAAQGRKKEMVDAWQHFSYEFLK
jgi:hypothetical protein